MPSAKQRQEIARFLKARRERIRPEDVGLPAGGRRRTPGLRREEVAFLAGISAEWYKWLEQARDVRASAQTLERIDGRHQIGHNHGTCEVASAQGRDDSQHLTLAQVKMHIERRIDHYLAHGLISPLWAAKER